MKLEYKVDKMLAEDSKLLHEMLIDTKLTDEECPDKKFVIFWNGIMDKLTVINKAVEDLPTEMYPLSQLMRLTISLAVLLDGKGLLAVCDTGISCIKDATDKYEGSHDESTIT